ARRALPADVLLARREREHVAALSGGVHGLTTEAAGELLEVLTVVPAREEAHAGAAEGRRARERLTLARGDVRAHGSRGFRDGERVWLRARGDKQRAAGVRELRDAGGVGERAVEARIPDDDARDAVAEGGLDG